ncbi:hypothetical protein CIPAW_13G155800 [Carya illinoinensis]|uniref:NB-ARC domain-containing protein n=1 Tax=Carya illinoinensis TaxID=32201 RepID=A0A8T1NQV9_CARIL|nr:hypothetical protein CIPAW_13G155800 [Carya illinoinensis]
MKMGHKIKEIRQKLDAIAIDRKFHLEERPVEMGVSRRKRNDSHSYVPEAGVIGREDAKKEIIKRLLYDSNVKKSVGILPITGIGGLGKTTLAQFIFNDEEIDKHFQLKMWVCVSESFEVEKVVEKILESAIKKKPDNVEMDTLVHGLRKEIGGKKYLLVLDDVWNEDVKKWDDLKVLLEGFIKLSNQNECLEDVGHEYFMDLLWRSFFQEAEMDYLENVIWIKMHDVMHDLASSVAGSFITKLESKEKSVGEKTRHVSLVNNRDFSFVIPTSSPKANRIRTLLSLGKFENLQESSTSCEAIFSSMKFLRVLDLHGRQLDLVPSSICKLKHLRDLDLSWNEKIEKLPDSITRLQNLYTLRLSGCTALKELPTGITKLVNLRHLYNDGCDSLTYMPRELGQLKNLQTLSKFVVHSNSAPEDSGQLSELNKLNSLRGELEIRGEDFALECKGANLKEKEHLQVLTLRWSRDNVNSRDEMALEGLDPHPNLKKLFIYNYGGVRVPMWLKQLWEIEIFATIESTTLS